jgi:glyoxylase-like metal-dependent hydrolase (beta-lactamase superfamily II)
MTPFICTACGTQYEPSEVPPAQCPICEDERQYINPGGQAWTTLEKNRLQFKNVFEKIHDGLYAIYSTPSFSIGQRAHLVLSTSGNILWDCITNLDETTASIIDKFGGIRAIAISHPHYFTTIMEWSIRFGNAPVYINALDAVWLGRKPPATVLWEEDEIQLWDGMRLIRCGGHFPGASVLHIPAGKGSLLVGDTIQVSVDQKTVSFMYSYPNLVPLPKKAILFLHKQVEPLEYDAIYGAFGKYILKDAKQAVQFSVNRYLKIFEDR